MNRQLNVEFLKELVGRHGENAAAKVSIGAKVGVSTLQAMMSGNYDCTLREATRERLCNFFKVAEDDLFPLQRDESAS